MKNYKVILKSFLILVIISVVFSGCKKDESTAEKETKDKIYKLSFSSATPDMHPVTARILKPWAERVEKATGGLVKITMYVGGTLVKADSMLDGVSTGLTDIGWVSNAYFPEELPLFNALAVPGFDYKRAKIASYIDKGFMEKFPQAVLPELEVMFIFSPAPGVLLTNKPVKTLEDLKGMQIRCDGVATKGVSLLGATPIAMPMAEAYESLSKNVIDGCVGPSEPLIGWNLAEVVKYLIEVPFFYNALPTVVMNKKVWNSLPADIRATIKDVNEKFFVEVASSVFDDLYVEGIKFGLKNNLTVLALSKKEQERWKKLLAPMHEQYAKKLNGMGLPGTEAMKTIQDLAKKYNKEFTEYDKEIQAKVDSAIKK